MMSPIYRKISLILFGLWSPFVFVQASPHHSSLPEILSQYHHFEADFSQTIYKIPDHLMGKFSGKIAFEKPGKFRWFVEKPNQQLILINQKKMWIYDIDLEQVTIKNIHSEKELTPAALLFSSVDELSSRFDIQEISPKGYEKAFLLKPKQEDPLYQSIRLFFDKDDALKVLSFSDSLGQVTKIDFQHVRLNARIDENLFKIDFPKEVDVING